MIQVIEAAETLRASNYTIYVDIPEEPGSVLLVHGYSGAYDKVSVSIANYVRELDVKPPKPLYGDWTQSARTAPAETPPEATLEMLKKRGYLTTRSRQDERAFYDRIVKMFHDRAARTGLSYVVMPTYDCNLRCPYCFQDHMRTDDNYRHLLRYMTPTMVDRIFASMPAIEARHGLSHGDGVESRICFFGGEPLLARNRRIVDYVMRKAQAHGRAFVFSAVSNMTEIDAYHDLLGPGGIRDVQVTIDGTPEEHDTRRIYADGSGSFEKIATNIDLCLDKGVNVDVRHNIDRNNVGTLASLAKLYVERGWAERLNFSAYAVVVHASNEKTNKKDTFNTLELRNALREIQKSHPHVGIISQRDDAVKANLINVFSGKGEPFPLFRATYCGAHSGMYVLDPLGDIYACWERTGDARQRIGWFDESGVQFVADRVAAWRGRSVNTNETCAQCRYSLYCGGGCAAYAEDLHGTIFGNYCDAFGRRFREVVAEAYTSYREGLRGISDSIQFMRDL